MSETTLRAETGRQLGSRASRRLRRQGLRFLEALLRELVSCGAGLEPEFECLNVRLVGAWQVAKQLESQHVDDGRRNLILDCEDVDEFAIPGI